MASTFARIAALCVVGLILQCTGILLFGLGFFPVKPALNGISGSQSFLPGCAIEELGEVNSALNNGKERPDQQSAGPPLQYDRVVFMVVDGLPAEFILGKNGRSPAQEFAAAMPYTQQLLATGAALGYHSKAAPPTVTMPRLKAMTSGAIAGFLDVAYNFNTQALLEDNWISQLAQAGWRMVLLGDNTWLKLFPNLFERHDGLHSFFVKDTVEVDRNVTRHLDVELISNNWDLLVLHYLGLDHVGHLGGRRNPLMAPKLKEMDVVITRIHQTLVSESSSGRRNLLVVVSDHGMTDSGNHGGATSQETDALALFVTGSSCNSTSTSFLDSTSGWYKAVAAYQVDIVPTMALLLGVPIPKNSVGALLPPLFSSLTAKQQLRALELNSWQLLRLLNVQSPSSICINKLCKNQQLDKIEETLPTDKSSGKLQMFCTLFNSALESHQKWRELTQSSSHEYMATFAMVKEAYLQFLKPTSEWLARGSTEKHFNFLLSGSCMMLISALIFLSALHRTSKVISEEATVSSGKSVRQVAPFFVKLIAIGGVCAHAASFGSSSLVEEEQYTWHFLACTLLLALIRPSIQQLSWSIKDQCIEDSDVISKRTYTQILQIFLLLFLGRVLRSWHQSGVNWTHLPDIAKVLDSGNPFIVTAIRIISVFSVTLLCCNMISKSLPQYLRSFLVAGLSFFSTLILLYMRYSRTSAHDSWATLIAGLGFGVLGAISLVAFFIFPWIIPLKPVQTISSKPLAGRLVEEELCNATPDMAVEVAMEATGQVLVSCWCLLQLLLQQPVNSGPVFLLLLQLVLTLSFFQKLDPSYQQWIPILTLHWLGASGHFGLGNSNTLATVDVAGAYIGLSSHSTVLSGILAFTITYGSPLLYIQAMLLLKSSRSSTPELRSTFSKLWALETFAMPVVLPLVLNSVQLIVFTGILILMQDHLFVWSVFSPKFLYVCMATLCVYIGIIVVVAVGAYYSLVLKRRRDWAHMEHRKRV